MLKKKKKPWDGIVVLQVKLPLVIPASQVAGPGLSPTYSASDLASCWRTLEGSRRWPKSLGTATFMGDLGCVLWPRLWPHCSPGHCKHLGSEPANIWEFTLTLKAIILVKGKIQYFIAFLNIDPFEIKTSTRLVIQ